MAYNKRRNGSYKPSWDRGNGWKETKPEWQDFDKAVEKTVNLEELNDMWCPASGSTITVVTDVDGLSFDLEVGPKEYNAARGQKRKPTSFGVTYRGEGKITYYPFIPKPDADTTSIHSGAWHKKFSWSAAVKELTNTIIPAYVKEGEAMCLRRVAQQQQPEVLQVQKSGEEETSAA